MRVSWMEMVTRMGNGEVISRRTWPKVGKGFRKFQIGDLTSSS